MRRILVAGLLAAVAAVAVRGQNAPAVQIDNDDIGGVVTGQAGPEAGVWVIAETDDLATRFRKIVVTDDQGRYVLPDLPDANYSIWVRGYGLTDSPKVTSRPGRQLALRAVPAPNPQAAAQYYPANHWFSLLRPPAADAFPIGNVQTLAQWISQAKGIGRFQIGTRATREIPPAIRAMGFRTTEEALRYYTTAGQMTEMSVPQQAYPQFVDWIDRIAAGAVPPAPARPSGIERNLVVTLWDVGNEYPFIHDIVSTDKRNPRVNPNGIVYGIDFHNDNLVMLNVQEHASRMIEIPAQVDKNTMRTFTRRGMDNPSPTWGDELIVNDRSNPNHLTMDGQGRVWLSAAVNVTATPEYCREGSTNRFAAVTPIAESTRHVALYDPRSQQFTLIHTCFRTHHVQMAVDGTNRLFANPLSAINGAASFGWIDIDVLDRTRNHEAAQGWCALYFDTDGDGRPNRDRPVPGAPYSVIQSPADGSLWGAVTTTPGHIVRLSLGSNPPETCVGEMYQVPSPGFIPRGIDVDSEGVIWTALAGSGHLASFDRRRCRVLTGEQATTGQHCAEGWTLHPIPGPKFEGVTAEINADYHYYNFVDRFDALGLGADTPLANGTNSDALYALDKRTGQMVTLRVPYPIGFYQRGMDGRIDDPDAGWKGRALWSGNGTRAIWHTETGKGTRGHIAKFQLRPNPLAR